MSLGCCHCISQSFIAFNWCMRMDYPQKEGSYNPPRTPCLQVCVITPEEEDKLWQSSVLSFTNVKALQRCVSWEIYLHLWWARAESSRTIQQFVANVMISTGVVNMGHGSKNLCCDIGDLQELHNWEQLPNLYSSFK